MCKSFALSGIIPAVLLVALSFFVLLAARKAEKEQGLKVFGYVIAALLWLGALAVFAAGISNYSSGRGGYKCMKPWMMKKGMGQMQEKGSMHSMMPQSEKK